MANAATATDVLIVGAGPVGLLLATECARRGLRWRIIEANATQSEHSKALAIFPRTLEILDMCGLVQPFLEQANRVHRVAVVAQGRALADIRFAPQGTLYPFIAMVPQNVTERLLVAQLQRPGGAVEYQTRFVSAVERDGAVEVSLERAGQPLQLQASFLVGCDGPHSAVRHVLNLPFEGKEYRASFLLADVDTNESLPADQMQLCPNEAGPLAIFPMSATRRRIVATIQSEEGEAPSLELVRRLLAERAPSGIEAHALHWSSYFRIHHRQVSRLRVGRIFIAGDAAHIHSPFGGQGMNTGLQDVWNLSWKLELAMRGSANETLLDSYSAERRPVIRQVIETTDLLTRAMATPSRFAQALRDTLIPLVSQLPTLQRAFVNRLSGLGIHYDHSPIVEGEGMRYFDESLRGGAGIGNRFVLMSGDDADRTFNHALHQFADSFRDVLELRSARGDAAVLVRPDGYVAYQGRDGHRTESLTRMRALLLRQAPRHGSPAPAAGAH